MYSNKHETEVSAKRFEIRHELMTIYRDQMHSDKSIVMLML